MTRFLINAIYLATEGEGHFLGTPQVFVRFQGCTIGCMNCDSKETWSFDTGLNLSFEQVVQEVYAVGTKNDQIIKRLSITGGDPLHPQHTAQVLELVKHFKSKGFFVNLEASGSRVVDEIFDRLDFISFDLKTPSTGVKTSLELLARFVAQYPKKHQIKAVVSDERDFAYLLAAYQETTRTLKQDRLDSWFITPCYDPEAHFSLARFQEILRWNENSGGHFRVVGQQHKWVYGVDQKQV